MRRLLCRVFGHKWRRATYVPTYYVCRRCHQPGFLVP